MNIGAAAAVSGVTAKMIRHYEAVGLLRPAIRRDNSYRDYGERDIHEIRFIGRARKLGFSMKEIEELLSLWRNQRRSSESVRRIAKARLEDLQRRLVELQQMERALRRLVEACHGDERPECPILEKLESDSK